MLLPADHTFAGLPKNGFACIAADPPWRFETRSDKGRNRSPGYDLMTMAQIKAMPVADLAARDSVLMLWVIDPMLPDGIATLEAWGFTFKTVAFHWIKTTTKTDRTWAPKYHVGLGYWSRSNPEICLLGTRGKPKRQARDVRRLLVEPRREHSRKPEEFYSSAERLVPGPYIELFSRTERPGWASFGNEVGKFAEAAE